jgi:hypothetical protein
MWRCARNSRGKDTERISRRIDKYQRYPLSNQRETEAYHDGSATPNQRHSSLSWGVWRSRLSFSDLSAGGGNTSWNSDFHKRLEALKKYIEADPYGAIFGRRLDPFHKFGKYDVSWNGFLQSTSNTERPIKTGSKGVAHCQTRSDANHIGLQYDPISGRMAPMAPTASQWPNEEANCDSCIGVDRHPGSEVKAKFTASSIPLEDGKHQPGDFESSTKSQLGALPAAECPPGNELEVNSTSKSATPSVGINLQVPEECTNKPNLNIDCSPRIERVSPFTSESASSVQPQSERSKFTNTDKQLSPDAGLTSGAGVECPRGSELETKFILDPASRSDEIHPSELNTQQLNASTSTNIECPPGNELEFKLTAELASRDIKSDDPAQTDTDSEQITSRESFDCSPGNEIEAQILSESASKDSGQSKAKNFLDRPPGNELEANFTSNPTSAEDEKFKPAIATGLDTTKTGSINIECLPGSELEPLFIADCASTKGFNADKDLDALDASETHTRSAFPGSKKQDRHLGFDASKERVGGFVIQNQTPATENGVQSSASQQTFPEFLILAFDTSTSQVLTAKTDSFFGINEDTRPSDILSRLHNPAKFLPYFENMQNDGYEFATGGGNILVFRKIHNTADPAPNPAEQDPSAHAKVARHLRHDSKEFTPSYHRALGQSSAEVSI